MSRWFYSKLALMNIRKNGKLYIPYILTCIFSVAMFYMIASLSSNEGILKLEGAENVRLMMRYGMVVSGITVFLFLFYTNSFLMKQRKKEFGLFNILGMEKRHLSKVLFLETCMIYAVSAAAGLAIGIIMDKAMYLVVLKLISSEVPLGFYISGFSLQCTLILFFGIFLMIFLNSVRQVHLSNPIELLRSRNLGEKEPKTKGVMAVIGILCLVCGYFISVSTQNPVKVMSLVFVAVLLVIAGTYLLFNAGSIAFLKSLRKNKAYYYQTNHFTSISGMIYRMKQNAAGLSNICILSTMVLVMVASTASMILGLNDILDTRFPFDISVSIEAKPEERSGLEKEIESTLDNSGASEENRLSYSNLSFVAVREEDKFLAYEYNQSEAMDHINTLLFITLDDYNRYSGSKKELKSGEILIQSSGKEYQYDDLTVLGEVYRVKEKVDDCPESEKVMDTMVDTQYVVLNDAEALKHLEEKQMELYGDAASKIEYFYGIDLKNDEGEQSLIGQALNQYMTGRGTEYRLEVKADNRESSKALYGGFFFIGIFLSTLFIIITILIIYYKQISEGYDDKERFEIMQKVGMSHEEVKRSIRSQILTVFFLPLVTAGVHVAFSVPFFSKILILMNLTNTRLFVLCTAACFLIFAVIYSLIYTRTAKVYYEIVSR